jgi:copper(I)-binding protein
MTATISSVRRELIEEAVKVTRWNRRLLLGAIAVLLPALAGCEAGYNAPTLQYHPASSGADVTQNGISLSNVFVLGAPVGSAVPPGGRAGVFLAMEAQNGDQLVSVSAPGTAVAVRVAGGSVNLPAQSLVDLSGPEPQVVLTGLTSQLSGGQSVQLSFNFAQAGTITLDVPVEPHAYDYATYSPPAIPSPTATGKPRAHASGRASASASASGSASSAASASPSATP